MTQTAMSACAQARVALYAVLRESLEYPGDELLAALREGGLSGTLQDLADRVDDRLTGGTDWDRLCDIGEDADLRVEYTRLFDAGSQTSGCNLYGALQGGDQMSTMEEVLRFYQHFGLGPSEQLRDTPDHLVCQLEFLHVLAFWEAECVQRGQDAGPFQRGQRDFIARHPGHWVPLMRARLMKRKPSGFFAELSGLLERFLAGELTRLEALHGRASRTPRRPFPPGENNE